MSEFSEKLRKMADEAWERGNKELSQDLHTLARNEEAKEADEICWECGLDIGTCVWCNFPDEEITDAWCPNCQPGLKGKGSTWHIVGDRDLDPVYSTCCRCGDLHPLEEGILR